MPGRRAATSFFTTTLDMGQLLLLLGQEHKSSQGRSQRRRFQEKEHTSNIINSLLPKRQQQPEEKLLPVPVGTKCANAKYSKRYNMQRPTGYYYNALARGLCSEQVFAIVVCVRSTNNLGSGIRPSIFLSPSPRDARRPRQSPSRSASAERP